MMMMMMMMSVQNDVTFLAIAAMVASGEAAHLLQAGRAGIQDMTYSLCQSPCI